MTKNKIRPASYLYPMAVVLVGANVKGKANFNAIGWVGAVEFSPPLLTISSNQQHYTNIGIKENQTFSVNTPGEDMAEVIDYCGLKTGKREDKSEIFEVFYGELETAPMIEKAPLNLECKLIHTIDTTKIANAKNGHDIFIGEVIQAYAEEKYLTNGIPDIEKIRPLIFSQYKPAYWTLGEQIGPAWSIGKNYKKK